MEAKGSGRSCWRDGWAGRGLPSSFPLLGVHPMTPGFFHTCPAAALALVLQMYRQTEMQMVHGQNAQTVLG